jgi:hypothetical protein
MFWGIEVFTIKDNGNEFLKSRNNVNVKQNLNEYTTHESLTLSYVETPIVENSNMHMYPKHKYGMKVKVSD